ncbi:GHMP family kinase ATP-binding protein [Candidatus Nitrospira salsa]|nr:MAG: GHMP kinase [Nitrospirales bacterium]
MIISRTPFRISFFGGGTDYPAWYRKHGGMVLAATIDKYCYLSCRYLPPFFEHRIRIVYSKIESCQTIDEIQHPAVREVLRALHIDQGVEIHHDGDLPARSGMGTSSAFTVGLLHALYGLKGYMPTKQQLAIESIAIEQDQLNETVGSQDQVLAAHGGLTQVTFQMNGQISVAPVVLTQERIVELNSHLMLFYTGLKRTAANVAETYVHDLEARKRQLRIMKDLVDEGLSILNSGSNLNGFGELLHEGWIAKRTLSAMVSNSEVDLIYERARKAGALGGKLTGAGGGGFLLLFVSPDCQEDVRKALQDLICVPFKFDFTGSQVIFCDREEDYSSSARARQMAPRPMFKEASLVRP